MRRRIQHKLMLLSLFLFIGVGWFFLMYHSDKIEPVSSKSEDLIRFHVLANSDSPEDQQLKLKVRDAVIVYLSPYLEDINDKNIAKKMILEHQADLVEVARQVILENGKDYPVDLEVGMFDFPIKSYGNLVLPAGKYEAVRILLGRAEGKNWWCVLFPPLCFVDATNATAVVKKSSMDQRESQDVPIEFRSKIAELWRENKN